MKSYLFVEESKIQHVWVYVYLIISVPLSTLFLTLFLQVNHEFASENVITEDFDIVERGRTKISTGKTSSKIVDYVVIENGRNKKRLIRDVDENIHKAEVKIKNGALGFPIFIEADFDNNGNQN